MNPDIHARDAALKALSHTQQTLDAIRESVEQGNWRDAAGLFVTLGQQASMGVVGCMRLVEVKREAN